MVVEGQWWTDDEVVGVTFAVILEFEGIPAADIAEHLSRKRKVEVGGRYFRALVVRGGVVAQRQFLLQVSGCWLGLAGLAPGPV